jgi:hypothetical protein
LKDRKKDKNDRTQRSHPTVHLLVIGDFGEACFVGSSDAFLWFTGFSFHIPSPLGGIVLGLHIDPLVLQTTRNYAKTEPVSN